LPEGAIVGTLMRGAIERGKARHPASSLSLACQLAGRKSVGEVLLKLDVPTRGDGFSNALYQTVGVELVPGHSVEWRNDGSIFEGMLADMGLAKVDVNIVTFIWAEGKTSGAAAARKICRRARCCPPRHEHAALHPRGGLGEGIQDAPDVFPSAQMKVTMLTSTFARPMSASMPSKIERRCAIPPSGPAPARRPRSG